jgi:hypothetical protein
LGCGRGAAILAITAFMPGRWPWLLNDMLTALSVEIST